MPINLSVRVFLVYFALIGVAAYWGFSMVSSQVKPTIRQTTEEMLVEMSNLLAEFALPVVLNPQQNYEFSQHVASFLKRRYNATIFNVKKEESSIRIYMTNALGIVIYDSASLALGEDYSQWNDVYLTLQGEYGARSSETIPGDESTSVMYVAAPVKHHSDIIGVLTVAKTNKSLRPFFALINSKLKYWGGLFIILSLLAGAILSYWLTGSIRKLVIYAQQLIKGQDSEPPKLGESELAALASAMKNMREQLSGKEYVEEYLLTMTHEMKSPLSAIMGAAELIDPSMPDNDLQHFSSNILLESQRLNGFIQRMLEVARVENLSHLEKTQPVELKGLITTVVAQKQIEADKKELTLIFKCEGSNEGDVSIAGNEFMLQQVVDNLIANAMEFSSPQGRVNIVCRSQANDVTIEVTDEGAGIPDYAIARVFERFYSLPRPLSGQRNSGLGLTFAKRAIELHGGTICVENLKLDSLTPHGVRILISLPKK
ncbi:MAG: two-component system sensor histidine kinase CreC [Oleispira sp.]